MSFIDEEVYVDESAGVLRGCVELSGVVDPTQSPIWASIYSIDGTALGIVMRGCGGGSGCG